MEKARFTIAVLTAATLRPSQCRQLTTHYNIGPEEHTTMGNAMLKAQSHIVAPIDDELRTRALYTVGEIRSRGKADKEAVDQLYNLIVDLTESGLDFFFLEPLRRLNAGSMVMGMARMGIGSMLKGSKMVVHKVLKKLDERSLASILDFIEEIIHEPENVEA